LLESRSLETTHGAVGLPGSSHAESALASGRDVSIFLNVSVVEVRVDKGSFRLARKDGRFGGDGGDLVGYRRLEEGSSEGCGDSQNGKEEGGGTIHHYGYKRVLMF